MRTLAKHLVATAAATLLVAGVVAPAAAGANTGAGGAHHRHHRRHHHHLMLSDAQRACLAEHGFPVPAPGSRDLKGKPGDDSTKTPTTFAKPDLQALRDALVACGIVPTRQPHDPTPTASRDAKADASPAANAPSSEARSSVGPATPPQHDVGGITGHRGSSSHVELHDRGWSHGGSTGTRGFGGSSHGRGH
jgi:hypothetical protein